MLEGFYAISNINTRKCQKTLRQLVTFWTIFRNYEIGPWDFRERNWRKSFKKKKKKKKIWITRTMYYVHNNTSCESEQAQNILKACLVKKTCSFLRNSLIYWPNQACLIGNSRSGRCTNTLGHLLYSRWPKVFVHLLDLEFLIRHARIGQ
jgi:hypothetical protein